MKNLKIIYFICISLITLACGVMYYSEPSYGAELILESNCSTKCYINGKETIPFKRILKIPLNQKTNIRIKAYNETEKKIYYRNFYYTLEADSYNDNVTVIIEYKFNKGFNSKLQVEGMKIYMN